MSTIKFLEEVRRFEARQNLYLIIVLSLFVIAVGMTLFLLYWPFDKEDDE